MRSSIDEWAMDLAMVTARRTTCLRRAVGCVILNKRNHVIATGYNGVAAGMPHCNDLVGDHKLANIALNQMYHPHACSGWNAASGTNLDGCLAIHAEQNALLQCRDVHEIDSIYITTSPCVTCTKLLLNTSCQSITFCDEYSHKDAEIIWRKAGRVWEKFVL